MSIDQRLIVLINTAINQQIESLAKYSSLKEAIKGVEALPDPVIKYVNEALSSYDQNTLTKMFHVLDYLTSVSPEKLQTLLKDEEFLEKLSFLVWEPTFQIKILSLITYWTYIYQKLQISCQNLENLSETINMSGIAFPIKPVLLYCDTSKLSKNKSESKFSKPKLFEEVDNEIEYYDADSFEALEGTKKAKTEVASHAGDNSIKDTIFANSDSQKKLAGAPERNGKQIRQQQQPEFDEIQINKANPGDALMTIDEILTHKTLECPQLATCPYKPVLNERNQYRNESLLCPYYHSGSDRRRPLSNKKGLDELDYSPKPCRFSTCNKDICELSHGFFEKMFHPLNYKKERCDKTQKPTCMAGKYCPYYHTATEKTRWETILGQFRQVKDDIADLQEVPEEIEMVDITGNNDQMQNENISHYPSRFQRRIQPRILEPIAPEKREYITVKSQFTDRRKFINLSELTSYGLHRVIAPSSKDSQKSQGEIKGLLQFKSLEEYCGIYNTTDKFASIS